MDFGLWVIGLTSADRKIKGLSIIKWCCHGSQDCTIGVKKETWVKYAKKLKRYSEILDIVKFAQSID